jgi:hypothetical protein
MILLPMRIDLPKNVQLVFQTQVVLILVVQITHTIQERVSMYQIVQSLITDVNFCLV